MKFGSLGVPELLIILVVVLLVFGPRRLPEMAKGIGQSVREFRKGIRDMKDEIDRDDEPAKTAAAPKQATVVESATTPTVETVSAVEAKPAAVTAVPAADATKEEVKA